MKELHVPLVIASLNIHKIQEIKSIIGHLPFLDLMSLRDFPNYTPPPETGNTFEENAIIKATHAALALNKFVLGDDSGLIVPALNNEPGIFSHRYAGNDATDLENRKKLLEKMLQLQDQQRYAYFTCSVALANPDGSIRKVLIGTCEGEIVTKERGRGGFGYDALFLKHEYNKTFAEMEETTKNRISHRRKALDKMLPILESLVK
jgi:XTP/dITP diphosphohydrolase